MKSIGKTRASIIHVALMDAFNVSFFVGVPLLFVTMVTYLIGQSWLPGILHTPPQLSGMLLVLTLSFVTRFMYPVGVIKAAIKKYKQNSASYRSQEINDLLQDKHSNIPKEDLIKLSNQYPLAGERLRQMIAESIGEMASDNQAENQRPRRAI